MCLMAKKFICLIYRNSNFFTVVFHHGGEFVKENNIIFYRGGRQTVVNGEKLNDWSKSHMNNLIRGWGYEEDSFRILSRFVEYEDKYFQFIFNFCYEYIMCNWKYL
jgi:hypothetical protein